MFATLKYHPQTSLSEVGNKASTRSTGSISRLACINCREKKLRCKFGERGCERCLLKGLECTYPQRAPRTGPKKNATFSNESVSEDKDDSRSPELVAKTPETWDSRHQPSDSIECLDHDVPDATPSRADSAVATYGETQPLGKKVSAHGGIARDVQFPTLVESPVNSTTGNNIASKAADEAAADTNHAFMDLSASEYDFSTTDIDAHGLDASRLSPLDSTIWCNDWLDPSWPQDSTTAVSLQQSGTEPSPSSVEAADVAKKKTDQGPMPTPTPTIPTKCNCVQLAIEALEKVTAWAEVDDFQLAHSALAAHKDLLTQCEAWLACTRCSSPSSVVMLILVITDKLIASFRHIHAFSQQSSAAAATTTMSLDDRAGSGPSSLARSGGGGGAGDVMVQQQLDRRISLGDYQIDSSGEWSLVMNVLLSSQLSRLGILFTKLWTRLNSSKEESQVQIIQQQQDRLRTFMTHLKRSTPCSGC